MRGATLLVALLVVLAGCAGGTGGGADGTATVESSAGGGDAAEDTETAGTATAAAGGATPFPAALDPALRHEKALNRSGSFTSTATVEMTTNDTTQTIVVEARVDTRTGRYLTESRVDGDRSVSFGSYSAGNATYVRVESDGVTQYQVVEDPNETAVPRPEDVSYANTMAGILPADFDSDGGETVTYAGEEMTRYEVTVEEFSSAEDGAVEAGTAGGAASMMSAESVTVVAFVDRQGVVRRLTYDLTAEFGDRSITQRVEVVIEDVGTTDVTEPDWVETAREQGTSGGDGYTAPE